MAGPIRIFISAGEASGDSHGTSLMEALSERRPGLDFFGCGGDHMRAAGCRTLVDANEMAMVGLVEVVPGLLRAWKSLRRLKQAIDREPPQLAILVDFPDFNLRLAKHLKRRGVPVLYFVAPQVWAWRKWRVGIIRRTVDRLLCIFPFEEKFFRDAGVLAEFIGNPLENRVRPRYSPEEFRRRLQLPGDTTLIALLPGSREEEIRLNLPPMLEAACLLAQQRRCHFVLPAASTIRAEWLRALAAGSRIELSVVEDFTYDAVAHSQAAIVASGTASTEAALLGTPLVIVYRVSPLSWLLGRWLVDVPFYSMVNLVAGREIVPEFIQERFESASVARAVQRLLDEPEHRLQMQRDLQEFRSRLHSPQFEGKVESSAGKQTGEQFSSPIQRAAAIAESIIVSKE